MSERIQRSRSRRAEEQQQESVEVAQKRAAVDYDALLDEIQRTIIDPTLREMSKRGAPFRGVLFAGVMVEGQTPRLLEYNVRLGDPEAEALLHCAAVDLLPVFSSLARGEPVPAHVQLAPRGCGAASASLTRGCSARCCSAPAPAPASTCS